MRDYTHVHATDFDRSRGNVNPIVANMLLYVNGWL